MSMSALAATRSPQRLLLTSASVIALSYAAVRVLNLLRLRFRSKSGSSSRKRGRLSATPEEVGRPGRADDGKAVLPEFDIVIVGGGTAGCVLAARLSEDPSIKVLLLEAGGSGKANFWTTVPSGYSRLFRTEADYNFLTVEQPNAAGRRRYWPRAKMLGGCSAMNAQMYHAGAPSDYDEWAESGMEGSEGWKFSEFQKYFRKFEKFTPNSLFPKVNSLLHGASGPVEVGYNGYFSDFCSKWIDACVAIGIPHNPDVNTIAGTLGATKIMTYTNSKGRRVTTETAYLTPEVLSRPNLTVATHASATKILFEVTETTKRAVGVEFARGKESARYSVRASKEVILSAGAVHTPHLLMVSGIGPAAHLRANSIPVIHDLPGVGQHLMDHPTINVNFRAKRGMSLMYLEPKGMNVFKGLYGAYRLVQWLVTGKGPVATNVVESAAFVRSTDPVLFPPSEYTEEIEDATSGADAPDIELFSSPFAWKKDYSTILGLPKGEMGTVAAVLLRPTSTGSITLNSADPFDPPIIDPNYFATRHDIAVLSRGLRLALRLSRTPPFSAVLDAAETDPLLDHALHDQGDLDVEAVVRDRAETLFHPTSTARMARLENGGVVDACLRVHGVRGLRVADASVFPTIVSGHTAAPVIAVAEKAADIIKDQLSDQRSAPASN